MIKDHNWTQNVIEGGEIKIEESILTKMSVLCQTMRILMQPLWN